MGPVALACAVALIVAGCGSSESGTTTTTTTSAKTSTAPATSSVKGGLTTPGKINYAKPAAGSPMQSGLIKISYHEFTINPDTVKAKVGSTIEWTNEDTEKCNVKSEGGPYTFDSGNLPEGRTFKLTLDKPGTIHYECTSYPTTMNGTIEVVS